MAGDRNTFNLGPARIDVDRELGTQLTQATTQAATVFTETLVTPELQLARATATALRGALTSIVTPEGSFFQARNATMYTVQEGDTVVYGKISDGSYVIVGNLANYASEGPGSLVERVQSGNDIGPCYPGMDRDNVLGLGANTLIFTRSSGGIAYGLAGDTLYATTSGVVGTLTVNGRGYWYGFFDGYLYMCSNVVTSGIVGQYAATLYRFNAGTGAWTSVDTIAGKPHFSGGAMYFLSLNTVRAIVTGSLTPIVVSTTMAATPGVGQIFTGNSTRQWTFSVNSGLRTKSTSTTVTTVTNVLTPAQAYTIGYNTDENDPLTRENHSLNNVDPSGRLMSLVYGSTHFAVNIITQTTLNWYIDDIFLNNPIGATFGNDPNDIILNGTINNGNYKMFIYGAYSPDNGTTFIPAIWHFEYLPNSGAYNLDLVWKYDFGTGTTAYVIGLHKDGTNGKYCWFAGSGSTSGPNRIYTGTLTG